MGLAAAIVVDASIIRLLIVPATMTILGPAAWWYPGWLDRLLGRDGTPAAELTASPVASGASGPALTLPSGSSQPGNLPFLQGVAAVGPRGSLSTINPGFHSRVHRACQAVQARYHWRALIMLRSVVRFHLAPPVRMAG